MRETRETRGMKKVFFQCPMPNAQCPMPNAQCPIPNN
ncbi:MAG: histidine kinase [Nostoc sp.]